MKVYTFDETGHRYECIKQVGQYFTYIKSGMTLLAPINTCVIEFE